MTVARERSKGLSNRLTFALAALIVLANVGAVIGLMRSVDITADEPAYVDGGRVILNDGWVILVTRFHGPLVYFPTQLFQNGYPAEGILDAPDRAEVLFRARLGMLPFLLVMLGVSFFWARSLFGNAAGLVCLAFLAVNPVLLAISATVSTDLVFTSAFLATAFCAWRFVERPRLYLAILVGVLIGLALATKFLAAWLAPLVALPVVLRVARDTRRSGAGSMRTLGTASFVLVGLAAIALLALHAAYGFRGGLAGIEAELYQSEEMRGIVATPLIGGLVHLLPEPMILGIDYLFVEGQLDLSPYLRGRFAPIHHDFYVWGLLVKTPEWIVALLGLGLLYALGLAARRDGPPGLASTLALLLPFPTLVFVQLSFFVTLQEGVRYVLLVYPVLTILAGGLVWEVIRRGFTRTVAAAVVLLLGVGTLELREHWPHLLCYFNRSSGGPGRAWYWFRNSNTSFGQLSVRGREILEQSEQEAFDVLPRTYFGPRFGRMATIVPFLIQRDPEDPSRARHWLLSFEPVRRVGSVWFLFDVTPEVFEQAVTRGNDARLRADLALAYLGAGRVDDARRHLELLPDERVRPLRKLLRLDQAARRTGATPEDVFRAVLAWKAVDRPDVSLRLLSASDDSALAAHPDQPFMLARTLSQLDRDEQAIELLEGVDPRTPGVNRFLGALYLKTRRYDDALELASEPGVEYPGLERLQRKAHDRKRRLEILASPEKP